MFGACSSDDGMYSGQLIYAGRRAKIAIGNILPLSMMPEGTLVCNLEQTVGDRGCLIRSSGNYGVIVAHNPENNISRIKMPSGFKKTINSRCRAVIGQISGSGRIEKPKLKAGVTFLQKLAKRKNWPRSRGVAMNPVDHPHGGGEGRTSGGRHPSTPWGIPTKGYKTRKNQRTDDLIVRRRAKRK
jgi:large subunit ribosomal protein L8e